MVLRALARLAPDDPDEASGDGPLPAAVAEPGVLEDLTAQGGVEVVEAGDVGVPFEARDGDTLERALLDGAGFGSVAEHVGMDTVRRTLVEAAVPVRRLDGSYRFENRFRFVIARRSPARSGRPARAGAR